MRILGRQPLKSSHWYDEFTNLADHNHAMKTCLFITTKKLNRFPISHHSSSVCSWALCSWHKRFWFGHTVIERFVYLSGCPLVNPSPAMKAASCLHESPKIVRIACLRWCRRSSFRQRLILYSWRTTIGDLLFTGVPWPSYRHCLQI